MDNPNCNICTRRKHCFVKEFTVLSCEDYREDSAEYEEERKSDEKLFTNTN